MTSEGESQTKPGGKGLISRFMGGTESISLSEEIEALKKENQRLAKECRTHEQEKAHDAQKIQELQSQLQEMEEDTKCYQEASVQLDNLKIKNRYLEEQTQIFRDMIIRKGGSGVDDVDDNTIIKNFVALREQIQRIVSRYYKCETPPRTLIKGRLPKELESRQRKFFSMWKNDLSSAKLKSRSRAMIFELLAHDILQSPVFGLDEFEMDGLESGLVNFEMRLERILKQDLTSWRISTMKCASLLRHSQPSNSPIRPEYIASSILEFMTPLQPYDKPQVKDLGKYVNKLCDTAFKLALTLRRCQDTYVCENPCIGDRVDEETMEPQENEGRNRGGEMKVAYVMSGCLSKFLEIGDGKRDRTVLEKAHIVITD